MAAWLHHDGRNKPRNRRVFTLLTEKKINYFITLQFNGAFIKGKTHAGAIYDGTRGLRERILGDTGLPYQMRQNSSND